MLCVFFRHCVSGNPTNCFGVFYSSTLLRFFVRRVFGDELLRRRWGGGAYLVSFVCSLRGNAVRFFAARFSGDLSYVFSKVRPEDTFSDIVGEKFSGANLYWERFIGHCRGFLYGKAYSFVRKTQRQKVLLLLAWLF